MNPNRQPPGSPAGGQFATGRKAGADPSVSLNEAEPTQGQRSDHDALDRIAQMLGRDAEWDGSADYLEAVAGIIAESGRPHPGNADSPGQYAERYREYIGRRGRSTDPTTKALDHIAVDLGMTEDWSSDELGLIAAQVHKSGRPHPGSSPSGPEYDRALRDWALREGHRAPDAQDGVARKVEAGEYGGASAFVGHLLDYELTPGRYEHDYYEGPSLTPEHFAALESDPDLITSRWELASEEIGSYAVSNLDPEKVGDVSDAEFDAHIATITSEAKLPHMAGILRASLSSTPHLRSGAIRLDRHDVSELDTEVIEPAIEHIQDRLIEAAES